MIPVEIIRAAVNGAGPAPEGCRLLPLTKGLFTLVDAADYAALAQHKWQAHSSTTRNGYYATRRLSGPKRKHVFMHHVILPETNGLVRDHRNGVTLDNRRENLRLGTNAQNLANRAKHRNGRCLFKGVYPLGDKRGRFFAAINPSRSHIRLGKFDTQEEAARAYDAAAIQHFGEWERVNFPAEQAA